MPAGLRRRAPTMQAWWQARIARQQEIDAAIAQAADVEMLYDRPYADPGRVRVAGPFTVESLSPHRIAATDETELADELDAAEGKRRRTGAPQVDFSQIVIDYLKSAGIHQSDKSGKIDFDSVTPWPGQWIGAEGRFQERDEMRRAAILIGPEYGTVSRPDLTAAAREANEADIMVPGEGFEPPTFGLQNRCTATVLTRQSQILSGDHPVIATLFATRRHRSPSRRRL